MFSKRSVTYCILAGTVALAMQLAARQQSGSAQPPAKAPAQGKSLVPDAFTNLKVLPKDITKKELVDIMKGFCKTANQRCSFCHVATDDLSSADFPSDEKETKKNARELLRMILEAKKASPTP